MPCHDSELGHQVVIRGNQVVIRGNHTIIETSIKWPSSGLQASGHEVVIRGNHTINGPPSAAVHGHHLIPRARRVAENLGKPRVDERQCTRAEEEVADIVR